MNTTTGQVNGTRYYLLPGGDTAVRTGNGSTSTYSYEVSDQHGTSGLALDSTAQNPAWRQFTPYGAPRGTSTSARFQGGSADPRQLRSRKNCSSTRSNFMCAPGDPQSDSQYVREMLLRWLPECRPFVTDLEENEAEMATDLGLEPNEVNVYSLLSEGFVWPVLLPALNGQLRGESLVERCAAFIEELVTCVRLEVRQAVGIRVIETIAGTDAWYSFANNSGAVTRGLVLDRRRNDQN